MVKASFNRTQLDHIQLALFHAESIIRNGKTLDERLCHDRIRFALTIIQFHDTVPPPPRDQTASPINGPGCQGDQLRGSDQ